MNVATAVAEVTVSATKSDANAVISGDVPNEGRATITLNGPGTTKVISILVTAPNGTSRAYTITVVRAAPSSDDALSGLTVSSGSLDPDFASGILDYRVDVAHNVDSVIISATKSDPNATMFAFGVSDRRSRDTDRTSIRPTEWKTHRSGHYRYGTRRCEFNALHHHYHPRSPVDRSPRFKPERAQAFFSHAHIEATCPRSE